MEKINKYILYIPYNLKIIIIKQKKENCKKIFILSENKYFSIFFNKNLNINRWGNSIIFYGNNFINNKIKIENQLFNFLNSWNFYYFQKIKFKGKGFRIKFFKKIKLIKFYFGKSHKTFLLLKKIKRKKISKYKFLLFSLNKERLSRGSNIINKIKNINYYTLRGLRLSRQIIFKRKGKKGTYI